MAAFHHALLGASVVALVLAALRLASPFAPSGLARLLSAAAFATAAAVAEAMLLGLVALGGSTAALTIAALATAAVAYAVLPAPELPLSSEVVAWWSDRSRGERALLGALAGAGIAWAAWQLRYPAIGFDAIHYHLPEMVIFVQGGHPGSVHDVLHGLPVGNYPLATEVTVGWAMGIARSLVPLILWPWILLALTAAAAWAGLRALDVPRAAAGLAAAALCTNPWLLAWQSNGSITDPPALAWLVVCAALVAMSARTRALLVPAVVAAGLAMGGKTTVLPNLLLVLAIGLWAGWRARTLPVRPLAIAAVVATGIGAFYYLRNLVTHGSPFWPLIATPWGDPVPYAVKIQSATFLDHPSATIDLLKDAYVKRFGGALIVLAAGLLAPLAAPTRRVVFASVTTLAGLILWAKSPITGINPGVALPETVFSTTRYALPIVAAACAGLAFTAVDARNRFLRAAPLIVLAVAAVVDLVLAFRLPFPVAPAATTPVAGAALGAIVAAILRPWRLPGRVVAVGVAAAAILLAIPADGFLKRHSDIGGGVPGTIGRRLEADAGYRDGSAPVATTTAYIGPLAGDRLSHRLVLIRRGEQCAALARRGESQWLVLYGGPFGGPAPAQLKRCLPRAPLLDSAALVIYRPLRP